MELIIFIFLFAAYVFTFGWVAKETAIYAARTGHNAYAWGGAALIFFLLPAIALFIVNIVEQNNR